MIEAHLGKLRAREILSSEEEEAIRSAVSAVERFPANDVLALAGKPIDRSLLVLNGWVGRSKDLGGYERQITSLSVPGDFADLHGFVLGRLDHDVTALTDCEVAVIPHARLKRLFDRYPNVARIYHIMGNIDGAIGREWAASLGRRSRAGHMAHLFCELHVRLDAVGRAEGMSCEFPLTQNQLADCLGATSVHVNRVLRELRASNLIRLEHRRLTILDHEGLRALARFDPGYLFIERTLGSTIIVDGNFTPSREQLTAGISLASRPEIFAQS